MTDRILTVTVESEDAFARTVEDGIQTLESGEQIPAGHTVSFGTQAHLMETFSPVRLELLRTIAEESPASIRETARLVDRDVKNVHDDLTLLSELGVVWFETEGRARRPLFPFDGIEISVEFDGERDDSATPASP